MNFYEWTALRPHSRGLGGRYPPPAVRHFDLMSIVHNTPQSTRHHFQTVK